MYAHIFPFNISLLKENRHKLSNRSDVKQSLANAMPSNTETHNSVFLRAENGNYQ